MSDQDGRGTYDRRTVLATLGALGATATASATAGRTRDDSLTLATAPNETDTPGDRVYDSLAAGLERRLPGLDSVSVRRHSTHAGVLRAVCQGEVALAAVDPFVARLAVRRDAATTLAQLRRGTGWTQQSHVLVRDDADVEDATDLAGEAVALGPLLSLADSVAPLGVLADAVGFGPDDRSTRVTWRQPADAVSALQDGDAVAAGVSDRVLDALTPASHAGTRSIDATAAVPAGQFLVTPTGSGPPTPTLTEAVRDTVAAGSDSTLDAVSEYGHTFAGARDPPPAVLARIDEFGSAVGFSVASQ